MNGLSIEHIKKSFGAVSVLHDVSLTFTACEVTAIVGDNGAGKSTLMKIIAGTHAPDSGRILLDGQPIQGLGAGQHRAQGIEMVYQDLALAKQQSTVANLFMGRELTFPFTGLLNRKRMTALAREKLAQLAIDIADLEKPVELLSGGQQQAVAIARAVMFDPKILLLDEPTAALAAKEVQQVLDLIRQQRDHGRTVILISHRLNDVFAIADRIIVMKQGRLVANVQTRSTTLPQIVESIVG